jgi:hypothetical protein
VFEGKQDLDKQLERKLRGYIYQKVAGSRAIAPHLDLQAPGSRSFHHLLQAVRRLVSHFTLTSIGVASSSITIPPASA